MTENEAKNVLLKEYRCLEKASKEICDMDCEKCSLLNEAEEKEDALYKAIKALEEIQQYRAIGKVARFEQLSKQFAPHNVDETSCHLRQCNKCDMYRKENEKYHTIGTIEEFKALKEKNVAKEPIIIDNKLNEIEWKCPVCGLNVIKEPPCQEYCQRCGNKLDRSE